MNRTFEQDIEDTALAQAGDRGALERLLQDYAPNIAKAARKWAHLLTEEDCLQQGRLVFIEYVMQASPEQARLLRRDIGAVVSHGVDEHVNGGIPKSTAALLRTAVEALSSQDEVAVDAYEAARTNNVSVNLLFNYMNLSDTRSLDLLLEETFDDDNPFEVDVAGGFSDDDSLNALEPEFASRCSSSEVLAHIGPIFHDGTRPTSPVFDKLMSAVGDLPERNRDAVLRYLEHPDLPMYQIADIAGVKRQTFESRFQRGIALLSKRFGTAWT